MIDLYSLENYAMMFCYSDCSKKLWIIRKHRKHFAVKSFYLKVRLFKV